MCDRKVTKRVTFSLKGKKVNPKVITSAVSSKMRRPKCGEWKGRKGVWNSNCKINFCFVYKHAFWRPILKIAKIDALSPRAPWQFYMCERKFMERVTFSLMCTKS